MPERSPSELDIQFTDNKGNPIPKSKKDKPPLGVTPRHIWIEDRFNHLLAAINRYNRSGYKIPQKWVDELSSLNYDSDLYQRGISIDTLSEELTNMMDPKKDTAVYSKPYVDTLMATIAEKSDTIQPGNPTEYATLAEIQEITKTFIDG